LTQNHLRPAPRRRQPAGHAGEPAASDQKIAIQIMFILRHAQSFETGAGGANTCECRSYPVAVSLYNWQELRSRPYKLAPKKIRIHELRVGPEPLIIRLVAEPQRYAR
jgi:hypothetical protein